MSVLSWNCQGAGSPETVRHLRELRRKFFPDFVFLMETEQKCRYVEGLKEELGYDELITVEPIGLSGDLAVFWKKCYEVEVLSMDKRIIDLKVRMGSLAFYLTCVYGDPVRERRKVVWDRLVDIGLHRNEAWVLTGDFNELMNNNEKIRGSVRNEASFWDFRNTSENCKIRDIRSSGNQMSWGGWRDKIWVQCRLDRCFGNDEWFHMFPRAQAEYLDMWASDHRPLKLSFALEIPEKDRGRFYFDKRMVNKAGFESVIHKGWLGNSSNRNLSVMERIHKCRQEIAKWKKMANINSRDRIQRLKHLWESEIAKTFPNGNVMKRIKLELSNAYKDEEKFWRQKCREQWLKSGDQNTNFFHNSVKGKKLQNKVMMLLDDEGREHFSEGAKGHIAVEYFKDLFSSSNPFDLASIFEQFPPKVTAEMNEALTKPITDEEIKKAAFGVKGSSAPGEDGLTGVFYKKFWHIVVQALSEEIHSFFITATIPQGWNHTQLCLLPKVLNPTQMKDMRPISLCSVHYKIVSRILCNRLKGHLPAIISDTKDAFVSDRLISDNILVAHEMVHGLRTVEDVAKNCMAVKTDMSKAYDRVEWHFLEVLLENLGFARQWVTWIMACVSTVSYTVLLNGSSHGFFRPERGLRQGDPLSPFLFILCAEALIGVLNASARCGSLHGIQLSPNGPAVHHMLFADDSLLLCHATQKESAELMRCLRLYGEATGQMINMTKSSIIFGAKVHDHTKLVVKEALGIASEGGEGSYLGLPECFSGSKRELLSFIREKLQGRLNGWFAKSLSQGGKEILLKSIAMALPVYAMSCFKLPKDLCSRLTSAMIEFWWSSGNNQRKISWVAWQKLCKSKEEGGLGFRDISDFNKALLGKQAWRICNNPNSLLFRILKDKYFRHGSFLECGMGHCPSYGWRSIMYGRELLQAGLFIQIVDGTDTRVWTSNWIMDKVPRTPNYNPDSIVDLTLSVSDLRHAETGLWNVTKLRETFTVEDAALIHRLPLPANRGDRTVWGFTKHGEYTTQSGYRLLVTLAEMNSAHNVNLPPLERNLWKSIWKIKAPPKLKHFLWKALSGALAVKERLRTRGIQLDTRCPVCNLHSESICHTLFTCRAAQDTWENSHYPLPQAGFSPSSVFLNIHHLVMCSKRRGSDQVINQSFLWIIWNIWKSRNALVFEKLRHSPAATAAKAREEAELGSLTNAPESPSQPEETPTYQNSGWCKPLPQRIKCNIGASWSPGLTNSGAAWVLRDHSGKILHHSRRAYTAVSDMASELHATFWAVEGMFNMRFKDVIFESSFSLARSALLQPDHFPCFKSITSEIFRLLNMMGAWSLEYAPPIKNLAANTIAESVTRDNRHQSYIAVGEPLWLHTLLEL